VLGGDYQYYQYYDNQRTEPFVRQVVRRGLYSSDGLTMQVNSASYLQQDGK